ncbi:hypothetical protein M501DRAFT_1011854 [Patellaria atrata CBS 101060]|uniref:SPRY domain-containing protein n=1 Tax=Patellaria atrata CBS 101060 TaxID=1346257 RepID=A0A9P4S8Y2_9PEZI|nr:hypothetical protein M501DRAFT_1011854 [Patellaria atrata CBS 101060]
MAEIQPLSRSATPSAAPALRKPLDDDHTPAVSSPLNPDSSAKARPKAAPREQRDRRETAKKRESNANTRGNTPDAHSKTKGPTVPSPMRYQIGEPKLADYEPPKDPIFVSREPVPLMTPDGEIELRKLIDHAENKRAFRYTLGIADPQFRHKQFYRQSDHPPYSARMSFEDSDKWIYFDSSASLVTNEKGWRMGRANVVARQGSLYYEVKIIRGVPASGPPVPAGQENIPQPHIRMGFARREAPLDAPVGFDGYSYGITDIRFDTMHRSRPGKLYNAVVKAKKGPKPKYGAKPETVPVIHDDHVREGDVIGLEISLPSLSLHRKVVEGIYNPAVDLGDGFDDDALGDPAADIIRDRVPVPYKGNIYFEQGEYQSTKAMESYGDRGPFNTIVPGPNHEDVALRSLPHSSIKVWKNGKRIGTAFEGLIAFLPTASVPLASKDWRSGFDDGMVGYFPAVAAFNGGIAHVNLGPDFWFPPDHLAPSASSNPAATDADTPMPDAQTQEERAKEARKLRPMSERYKEQIAEDVTWDIVDETDFFVQDGAFSYKPPVSSAVLRGGGGAAGAGAGAGVARGTVEAVGDD